MVKELEEAVREVYAAYEQAADAIISDLELAVRFAGEVNRRLRSSGRDYPAREIMRCLLNMRTRGKLPRKHRSAGG